MKSLYLVLILLLCVPVCDSFAERRTGPVRKKIRTYPTRKPKSSAPTPVKTEEEKPASREEKKPWLNTAIGLKVGNIFTQRGAIFYDALYLSPILYAALFEHRLQFFGNSLEYTDFFIEETLRGRFKIAFFNDDPTIVFSEPKGIRNSRESAIEATATLEWFIPDRIEYWGQFDLSATKGLKAHFGTHFEATARVTLIRLVNEGDKALVQPQLFATVGYGTQQHNSYLYGAGGGDAGFNYVRFGLYVISPSRVDSRFPLVEMAYHQVLGGRKNGALVQDRPTGFQILLTFATALFSI